MAVRIKFDQAHNVIHPTFVLATRSGRKLGVVNAEHVVVSDAFNSRFDLSFQVSKKNNGEITNLWNDIVDFKLIWCKEWDVWFEIYVTTKDDNDTIKYITCVSLGEAELSQIILNGIEINTENDIAREEYIPTTLFNPNNHGASLLHRIMEKCPHYTIRYVSPSISDIQRTFKFDGETFYDALQKIASEIECIFVIDSGSNDDGSIKRSISAFDLESYCVECGHRGHFHTACPECGSTNVIPGYGLDTAIFVSTENLADNIVVKVDTASVKNCFRLVAGDDLMTAAIMGCNPNGSQYIWYLPNETKQDMSEELRQKIAEYDAKYEYYYKEHVLSLPSGLSASYNALVAKYSIWNSDLKNIPENINGYPELMRSYFDTIDFHIYLRDAMMPSSKLEDTSAGQQAALLTGASMSPIAVSDLNTCSSATVSNIALSVAKTIIDSRYRVKVKEGNYSNGSWTGKFLITNYSDETDSSESGIITVSVNDDYEKFVRQKIDNVIRESEKKNKATDIASLFAKSEQDFSSELKKYCLNSLSIFADACQACLDILVKQGIADRETWADKTPDMYTEVYLPFYNKLGIIGEEASIREKEICVIAGKYDADGDLISDGVQNVLEQEREVIQQELNIEESLGLNLWKELLSYRREDTYTNDNYISDGLNNSDLFKNASEFVETARKEIFKSSTQQHTLSASLKNLLVMREFTPIVDKFAVGNWIRVKINDVVYRLRMIRYQIDFDSLENIQVEFSDVQRFADGVSDTQDIINQASSMAGSYGSVAHQASQGDKGNKQISEWVDKGLALTKLKIIDSADNQNIVWDSHGMLCREKVLELDKYSDKQLKIINRGLYLTDDNWRTSKAGIGDFAFYNPETGKFEEAYGVIADTLVGNLILSEKVGVYNTSNSILLDKDGLTITTAAAETGKKQTALTIQRREKDQDGNDYISKVLYIDSSGNVVLNGSIRINTSTNNGVSTLNDITDPGRFSGIVQKSIHDELYGENGIYTEITNRAKEQKEYTDYMLNQYKADIGQYLRYDENGLTLGAVSSTFKTIIDNQRLAFYDENVVAAYISNKQLFIPNAVIKETLTLGRFFFSPRGDGGVSIVWKAG